MTSRRVAANYSLRKSGLGVFALVGRKVESNQAKKSAESWARE